MFHMLVFPWGIGGYGLSTLWLKILLYLESEVDLRGTGSQGAAVKVPVHIQFWRDNPTSFW